MWEGATRKHCEAHQCNARTTRYPMCGPHWRMIPEDIKERIQWAKGEGEIELEAALQEARPYAEAGDN